MPVVESAVLWLVQRVLSPSQALEVPCSEIVRPWLLYETCMNLTRKIELYYDLMIENWGAWFQLGRNQGHELYGFRLQLLGADTLQKGGRAAPQSSPPGPGWFCLTVLL